MTHKTELGESSFNLAFSTKNVLPPKIIFPTYRVENFDKKIFKKGLRVGLDLISEVKAKAYLKALRYRKTVIKLYDRGVYPRRIGPKDLVL